MKIAFIIYNGMTALDFIGVYDPLTRLKTMGFVKDLQRDICAHTAEVRDSTGLQFVPTRVGDTLSGYDMVIVPGGTGSRVLLDDAEFIEWLSTAGPCKLKVSVCTGALLLAAAGFLKGKKATTHRSAFKELMKYGVTVVDRRIVDENDVITARGVASSIDLGLYLCEKIAGKAAKERILEQIDYQQYH
jgi:transcriptional regulator GlxA family with amidase domain